MTPSSMSFEGRRVGYRQPLCIEASVFGGLFDAPVRVETADLSNDGLFLRSDLLLEAGERVLLSFDVPGTRHTVVVDGRVVRAIHGGRAGMGIAFERLPRLDAQILYDALLRRRREMAPDARTDGAFRC